MNKNKNLKIIEKNIEKTSLMNKNKKNRDYQKEYYKNMTDEKK